MTYLEQRFAKLSQLMLEEGLEALLINNLKNVYYLTGFWATNATVFVTNNRRVLVTDDRYITYARSIVKGWEVVSDRSELSVAARVAKEEAISTIAFEDEVSVAYHTAMQEAFAGCTLRPTHDLLMRLRQIKDAVELEVIRKACQISDQAFIDALDVIKPGKTEIEIANFLDFRMRELGASGVSFDTISASGYRSSMPHGRASDKVIQAGDALTLDFGALYQHYASDMTRTVYVGSVSDQETEIYETVLAANQALIHQAKAGLTFGDFDGIPRGVITDAGYGDYFTHGIGHGLGLDIHEVPFFSRTSTQPLESGMVVTDEPGIYLPEKYGVRIEDDLLITDQGCEVLTHAPKELIVLPL